MEIKNLVTQQTIIKETENYKLMFRYNPITDIGKFSIVSKSSGGHFATHSKVNILDNNGRLLST